MRNQSKLQILRTEYQYIITQGLLVREPEKQEELMMFPWSRIGSKNDVLKAIQSKLESPTKSY